MEEKQEIQVVESRVAESPLASAAAFIKECEGKVDISQLGELFKLQREHEANEARKAHVRAMAAFKADPPRIIKDMQVSYPSRNNTTTGYKHASLGNVTSILNTELSKHGLTATWIPSQENGIKVTCRVTHIQGHFEEASMTAPPDDSGAKNKIQAIGSTVTYLERYTILALLGLATHEQDDDGQGGSDDQGPVKFPDPTEEEIQTIAEICALMKPESGFMVDPVLAAKVFYAHRKEYPPSNCDRLKAATWLWEKKANIYKKDNRSGFEKDYELPGDENSQAEQQECRYYCSVCSGEYDELNENGRCPTCFNTKVTDRRPE